MKIIIFFSVLTFILSDCASGKYEYEGSCYSSCEEINLLNHEEFKKCVPSCKVYNLPRLDYKCKSCYSYYFIISNSNNIDNYCVESCLPYGKINYNARCLNSYKENSLVKEGNKCLDTCYNYNYVLKEQNEDYCISDCLVFGLYSHNPCTKNCKENDKYFYK